MRSWLVVCWLAGCGRIGFDPAGTAGGDDTAGPDGAGVACAPFPGCPVDELTADTNGAFSASQLVTADHGIAGSCGGNANPEASWRVTPLRAGSYTIVVKGGSGLVHVRDACCDGPELLCTSASSQPVVPRAAGRAMMVFVETLSDSIDLEIRGAP